MFKKVAYDITNTTAKSGYFEQSERKLLEQKLTLSDTHEPNESNFTNLNSEDSAEKSKAEVRYQGTLPTKYIKISEFFLSKIPATKGIRIMKSSIENNSVIHFKRLKDTTGLLSPALCDILCNLESHGSIDFDTNQESIKNILAKKEKNDILERACGLIKSPVSLGFKEGIMYESKQHVDNSQGKQQLQARGDLKSQIGEQNSDIADMPIEKEKNQSDNNSLGTKNQDFDIKREKPEIKSHKRDGEDQQVDMLKFTGRKLKSENKELKTKTQGFKKDRKTKPYGFDNIQQDSLTSQKARFVGLNNKMTDEISEEKTKPGEVVDIDVQGFDEKDKRVEKSKAKFLEMGEKYCDNIHVLNRKKDEKVESQSEPLECSKDSKNLKFNLKEIKNSANYTLAFLMLFVTCVACASFAAHYLAVRSAFAVAASVLLALECYCLCKSNNTTSLDNVEISQVGDCPLIAK